MLVLTYRHIKWGLVSKVIQRVLMAPSDSRYTQVGLNPISVLVCWGKFLFSAAVSEDNYLVQCLVFQSEQGIELAVEMLFQLTYNVL